LFKKGIFEKALPNAGYYAIADVEQTLGDSFHLITQNIDGLHLLAGNSREKIYEIHGTLQYVRCSRKCTKDLFPFPEGVMAKADNEEISDEEWELLKCPHCRSITRPNILWFDERYNEKLFKLYSALRIAKNSGILFIVGTSGATNLPNQLVAQTLKYGGTIVDINIEENHFSKIALSKKNGFAIRGKSSEVLPELAQLIKEQSFL
jgi:NAD-dependent deacetylase